MKIHDFPLEVFDAFYLGDYWELANKLDMWGHVRAEISTMVCFKRTYDATRAAHKIR